MIDPLGSAFLFHFYTGRPVHYDRAELEQNNRIWIPGMMKEAAHEMQLHTHFAHAGREGMVLF